jgi:protein tyrosine phosphatase (PTP) superfamily phosphohydrolase (DUF442 family)
VNRSKIIVVGFAVASITSGILLVEAVLSTHAGRGAPVAPSPIAAEESRNAVIRTSLPLYQKVNEDYRRGSEPAHGGIETLINLGVRSVVDLRSSYDRNEEIKIAAERSGLAYYWLPFSVWEPPSNAEANEFISLVTDRSKGPFFVFCTDGIHRTGEMTAIYRLVNDNWDILRALKEMDEVGFNPYYYSLRNYVWRYARKYRPGALPKNPGLASR